MQITIIEEEGRKRKEGRGRKEEEGKKRKEGGGRREEGAGHTNTNISLIQCLIQNLHSLFTEPVNQLPT
jgi:hypothetical protein